MQFNLRFPKEEYLELKGIVKRCYNDVKKRHPNVIAGESVEEYQDFIRDEVLLELAERLKEIALRRQNEKISYFYKKNENN